jgi:hypothetical protein
MTEAVLVVLVEQAQVEVLIGTWPVAAVLAAMQAMVELEVQAVKPTATTAQQAQAAVAVVAVVVLIPQIPVTAMAVAVAELVFWARAQTALLELGE